MWRCQSGAAFLMASLTLTLSTTDQVRPASETIFCRSWIAETGHSSPGGMSCSAVTMPVAPAWRASESVTLSRGPNQRQVCSMCSLSLRRELYLQLKSYTEALRKLYLDQCLFLKG